MEKNVAEKLKLIDNEISNALSTITELEEKLAVVKTDNKGNMLMDECITLKQKFSVFNRSLQELTDMLAELGIIDEEDKL